MLRGIGLPRRAGQRIWLGEAFQRTAVPVLYAQLWDVAVRVARFHNIFGPEGTWTGGKEKAPAAICRKVAEAEDGGEIEIWGDGKQTRSFLYIDECIEGVRRLMESSFTGPVNIGSEEMVTINQLAEMVMQIAGKKLAIKHISGPLGVRGRNSDNRADCRKAGLEALAPAPRGTREDLSLDPGADARGKDGRERLAAFQGSRKLETATSRWLAL